MNNASQQEQNYALFTKEMKKTHTILIPGMLPIHFAMLKSVLQNAGYKAEILHNTSHQVIDDGLKYVNNDICYPAMLVIGQLINALEQGDYDLDHTALMLTQTGGGCRASNYIYLLRKALEKAGLSHIPVISLNVNGMSTQPGFKLTLSMLRKFLAALVYGDTLMYLTNKLRPYEVVAGATEALKDKWLTKLCAAIEKGEAYSTSAISQLAGAIAQDFAKLETKAEKKLKVGIVGEIYIKYSALGNSNLESFLQKQNCEYMLPGVFNFIMYCVDTYIIDYKLYGGSLMTYGANKGAMWYLERLEKTMIDAIAKAGFVPPTTYAKTKSLVDGVIGLGNNMGEGWLLTAEMLELIHSGYNNIICAQPFGCLPNHIAGRGMINKIKELEESANILALDFDASSSHVNQENRIKLMLATAE